MSTVPANQEMAQPNELNNSGDMSAAPMKRKRGRPRKDEVSESEFYTSTQQRMLHPSLSSNHSLVGQTVSGSLVGVFDAGYLLNVQVGSTGPTLRGLVFDPRLSIPVSSENDVAPHLPMLRRDGLPHTVKQKTHMAEMASSIHNLQANVPPSSPFPSQELDSVHPNIMEVTSMHSGHVPLPGSEAMDLKLASSTTSVGTQAVADVSLEQRFVTSSDPSFLFRSDVSKVSNTASASKLMSLDLSKPPDDSPADEFKDTPPSNSAGVSMEAVAHASDEPSDVPKGAPPAFTELSLNVSVDVPWDVSKPSDAFKEAVAVASKTLVAPAMAFSDLSREVASDTSKLLATQALETVSTTEGNVRVQRVEESLRKVDELCQNSNANNASEKDSEIAVGDKTEGDGSKCL